MKHPIWKSIDHSREHIQKIVYKSLGIITKINVERAKKRVFKTATGYFYKPSQEYIENYEKWKRN